MKKFLLSSFIAFFGLLIFAGSPALAATNPFGQIQCKGAASSSPVCHASSSDPITGSNGIIVKITRLVALAAGFAAVVFIIIGGINYIISNGDSAKISKAKDMIIFACVGLIVIVLAQYIITFVVSKV